MRHKESNAKIKVPHEIWASVTERGQVTIPAEVRKKLGLSKRGKVIFRVEDGLVVLKKPRFSSIAEIVADAPKLSKPMEWREMLEIAHEEVAMQVAESMRREVEDRE
jgi:AbrB family looped-hinge helix DNA binding protein